MRRLSRRRPMKLQGFSVRYLQFFYLPTSVWAASAAPHPPLHISHCVFRPGALRFPLWTYKTGWTHFHNLMLFQGQLGWVWWEVGGWMDTFNNSAQITQRDTELDVTERGMVSCTIVQLLYLPISVHLSSCRWHWRPDGSVHWSQCSNNIGNIWLPIWGKCMLF